MHLFYFSFYISGKPWSVAFILYFTDWQLVENCSNHWRNGISTQVWYFQLWGVVAFQWYLSALEGLHVCNNHLCYFLQYNSLLRSTTLLHWYCVFGIFIRKSWIFPKFVESVGPHFTTYFTKCQRFKWIIFPVLFFKWCTEYKRMILIILEKCSQIRICKLFGW
jgi:hypothetical protein